MRSLYFTFSLLVILYSVCTHHSAHAEKPPPVFFAGKDDLYGKQLWQTDHTAAGTRIHSFLTKTPNADAKPYVLGSIGNIGIFSAFTPEMGQEVWRTDGTTQGTFLLKDFIAGAESGMPSKRTFGAKDTLTLGKQLLFWSRDPQSLNLTVTDGTANGTQIIKRFTYTPASISKTESAPFYLVEQTAFFWVDDGEHGVELWRSDGTPKGTQLVADMTQERAGAAVFYTNPPLETPTALYFIIPKIRDKIENKHPNMLWRVTTQDTQALKEFSAEENISLLAVRDHQVVWVRYDTNYQNPELWLLDTNNPKTSQPYKIASFPQLKDISISVLGVQFYQDQLYWWFTHQDQAMTMELWHADLATQKVQMLVSLPQPNLEYQASPEWFTFSNRLYFFTKDGVRPAQLWITDGTPQGTRKLLEAQSPQYGGGAGDSWYDQPHSYVLVGDRLVFPMFSAKGRTFSQLWSLAPNQPEKPELLGEFDDPELLRPSSEPSDFIHFMSGQQRWQTDGTKAGTNSLGIDPLRADWVFSEWPAGGLHNTLSLNTTPPTWLMPHSDKQFGQELWVVATDPKTSHVTQDINTAPASNDLEILGQIGSIWYYRLGHQLWWMDANAKPMTGQLVAGIPDSEQVVMNAYPVATDANSLYFLTKQQDTILWQATQRKASQLTQLKGAYAWLFPSQQGVYLAVHPTTANGYELQHWQDGKANTVLKHSSPDSGSSVKIVETTQGLIYIHSTHGNYEPDKKIPANNQLFWRPTNSSESYLIKEHFETPSNTFNSLAKTKKHIYLLHENPEQYDQVQLVRIDLTQKRTIPINKWKKLSNITRMVATPNGLFVLTDIGQPNHLQSQLWFLADDASEPKLIKQFSPEEFVEMASTHENTLYLNIRLREEYEKVGALWMSDGTAEGTRLIKQGVEMDFSP